MLYTVNGDEAVSTKIAAKGVVRTFNDRGVIYVLPVDKDEIIKSQEPVEVETPPEDNPPEDSPPEE